MSSNYIYRTAEKSDFDRILKFLAEHFYHEEPSIRVSQKFSVWNFFDKTKNIKNMDC